ncbi:complement C1q tumor necrosis factor-related protein 6-like [Anabas testudineus]|uniref:complement C1q tumor necrosis factor-related protein 6-like n=1 Tax=Anabas testudineus TaxID=64144 RepID=UPI000E4574BF|nr:complement C1q tumor necrosis factor-related protein 6-like [Anabas testudineus]
MSCPKICSVVGIVTALCMTGLILADPAERTPRQTAAREHGGAVLFSVAYQGQLRDVLFNPIIFDHVLVNQGSAYNNDTGVFIAPVPGIYQFVFAAQLCRGNHNNIWNFMVNGDHRMACHAQMPDGDTVLNTCYFMGELQQGDQVWVKQQAESCAWASTTSNTITFSGMLLASEGMSTLGGMYSSGTSGSISSLGQKRTMVSGCDGLSASLLTVVIALLLCCILLLN